jgi:stage III sporulation protein AH
LNRKKLVWAAILLALAGGIFWLIRGLNSEMQAYEVLPDEELVLSPAVTDDDLGFDTSGVFFVEYRLQRERVRDQEVEMLQQIIKNPNSSPEAKLEAENMLLEIVDLMEQELIVENLVKAQGIEDAIFFFRNRVATVMVKRDELTEQEFGRVSEAVAGAVGVEREEVQVIARP